MLFRGPAPEIDRPTCTTMIRHSLETHARAKLLAWMLAVLVVLLPGASYQKRYDCRMTGARGLAACCCTGASDCAPEVSSCDSGDCCPDTGGEEKETADDCGCCDIRFERVGTELAVAPHATSTSAHGPVLHPALLPAPEASPAPIFWFGGCAPEKVPRRWTGPPVYLRFRALLI